MLHERNEMFTISNDTECWRAVSRLSRLFIIKEKTTKKIRSIIPMSIRNNSRFTGGSPAGRQIAGLLEQVR